VKRIQLAVRDFALPVPRKGSIEVHSGYGFLPQSADQAHALVQGQRSKANAKYKTEVKISHSFERGAYVFVVSGRMDGFIDGQPGYIEEIKTAFDAAALHDKLLVDEQHPYRLQLLTYAYMHSSQTGAVPACALYIASYAAYAGGAGESGSSGRSGSSGSAVGDSFELPILLDMASYEAWLDRRLDELVLDAEQRAQDKARRKAAAKTMCFPFANARAGQLELIDSIERSLVSGGDALMVQAPTGMGKTAAVIFPTLRDALRRGQKLIYVTPKNSQHQVAIEAVQRLRESGKQKKNADQIRSLTLTAKSKMCLKGEPICNPEHCEFAQDYYGKVAHHRLVDKAAASPNMHAELFTEIGKEYEVCPFELSVDSIHRADVIVGDYNYVFSPISLLGRFTGYTFGDNEKPNLVIDEAHNLPARACDYFSPEISAADLEECRARLREQPLKIRGEGKALLKTCLEIMTRLQPKDNEKQRRVLPPLESFQQINVQLGQLLSSYLRVEAAPKPGDPIVGLCRLWGEFSDALARQGEQYFCTSSLGASGSSLRITCCDASEHLAKCLQEFQYKVAFSATLKPFDYYLQLSGFNADKTTTVEFTSPFPTQNRKLMVIPQVSTKYSDRSRNYDKIAQAIMRIIRLRRGNYFIFFPSFAFLREVFDRTQLPEFNVLQQRQGMTGADVQKFIDSLHSGKEPTAIFAVQGGALSEGVDYPGEALIGAFIVGPSLPGFDLERELMRDYYEKKFGQGFDYAYTYPAMARVVQAAGRVIRSENDRGLIVLMDRRFTMPAYTATMPGDWYQSSVKELVSNSIVKDINAFWNQGVTLETAL
jgi:DNA excision repair protein ERCC-2